MNRIPSSSATKMAYSFEADVCAYNNQDVFVSDRNSLRHKTHMNYIKAYRGKLYEKEYTAPLEREMLMRFKSYGKKDLPLKPLNSCRFISFNVHAYLNPFDGTCTLNEVNTLLQSCKPDVLCIQEHTYIGGSNTLDVLPTRDFSNIHKSNFTGLGNLLCSDAIPSAMNSYPVVNGKENRPFHYITVKLLDVTVDVWNIHPTAEPKDTVDQIKSFLTSEQPYNNSDPVIIFGDWNISRVEFVEKTGLINVSNYFKDVSMFPTNYHGEHIDYCFCNQAFLHKFEIKAIDIIYTGLSDHALIYLDVTKRQWDQFYQTLGRMNQIYNLSSLYDRKTIVGKLGACPLFSYLMQGEIVATIPANSIHVHSTFIQDATKNAKDQLFELQGISNIPMSYTPLYLSHESLCSWYGSSAKSYFKRLLLVKNKKSYKYYNLLINEDAPFQKRIEIYNNLVKYYSSAFNNVLGANWPTKMRMLWIAHLYNYFLDPRIPSALLIRDIVPGNIRTCTYNHEYRIDVLEGTELQLVDNNMDLFGIFYDRVYRMDEWTAKAPRLINEALGLPRRNARTMDTDAIKHDLEYNINFNLLLLANLSEISKVGTNNSSGPAFTAAFFSLIPFDVNLNDYPEFIFLYKLLEEIYLSVESLHIRQEYIRLVKHHMESSTLTTKAKGLLDTVYKFCCYTYPSKNISIHSFLTNVPKTIECDELDKAILSKNDSGYASIYPLLRKMEPLSYDGSHPYDGRQA